ncbi:MAG: hypothetical protein P8180_07500 [Gammaproteobacteria bacterium]|jgi:hypothetical protein
MPWTELLTLLFFAVPGVGTLAAIEVTLTESVYPAWFGPAVLGFVFVGGLGLNLWLRRRFVFDRFWRAFAIMTVPIAALGPLPAQMMNVISLQSRSGQAVSAACLLWLFLALALGGVWGRHLPVTQDR